MVVRLGNRYRGNIVHGCFAFGDAHEELLRIEKREVAASLSLPNTPIRAGAVEGARLHSIGQIGSENLGANAVADLLVTDGEDDLATLEEIAVP